MLVEPNEPFRTHHLGGQETRPAELARDAGIHLVELLEQVRQVRFGDADAGVLDLHAGGVAVPAEPDGHPAAGVGELDGVADDVEHHLAEARGVHQHVSLITGTGTGVGKTVATAALACCARRAGIDVAVCKPVQTGTDDGDDDLAEVARLSGVTELAGLARYPRPVAPAAAAELAGAPLPTRDDVLTLIAALDRPGRLTLVEGAGGLLVQLADRDVTLRDLAVDLGAAALVVATAELGTLNHTELTVAALRGRGIEPGGLVIGSWPSEPGLAETCNLDDLPRVTGVPLIASIPAGAGNLTREEFTDQSPLWFT